MVIVLLMKQEMRLILFGILTTFLLSFSFHEFHVSKCLVNYSEEDQSLQISIHIFIDDFESALKDKEVQLFLGTEKEKPSGDQLVASYLSEKLKIKVDGVDKSFEYIGKEISEDLEALWCYFEIENTNPNQKIEIENTILMELFDDQKNIVSLKGPLQTKAYFLFVNDYFSDTFEIE